jgi:hypothetical protein
MGARADAQVNTVETQFPGSFGHAADIQELKEFRHHRNRRRLRVRRSRTARCKRAGRSQQLAPGHLHTSSGITHGARYCRRR